MPAALGLTPPLRESGDLAGTPGAVLVGTAGELVLTKGIVAALRHIHMNTNDARDFGVKDGDRVKIRVPGERGTVFENVVIRWIRRGRWRCTSTSTRGMPRASSTSSWWS